MKNHLDQYSMRALCQALEVSRSGFYAWRSRPVKSCLLDHKIEQMNQQHKGRLGGPAMAQHITKSGFRSSERTVGRRMRKLGIKARFSKRFRVTTDSGHKLPVANNILNREFTVQKPDQVWVTDITYILTNEGWLYLAVMLDLFSRKIVGWHVSNRIDKDLVCSALEMALMTRGFPVGVLVHSDRGSQYCSELFIQMILQYKLHQSMSRKGNCWDNAVAESFFATLKKQTIHGNKFETREQARLEVFEYIEGYYNRVRRHSTLDWLTPIEFEDQHTNRSEVVSVQQNG
jgi:putative transposase